MRILFLGNNWVAWNVLEYLRGYGEDIVGLVIHPEPKQKYTRELITISGLPDDKVFDGASLREKKIVKTIKNLKPDLALSIFFDYILDKEFISLFPCGVINLHPAYLPFNRGQYPNVWSIIEDTPSGVTLHYIDDEKIDSGDIICQERVPVEPTDTGFSLYKKLELASVNIFCNAWSEIKKGNVTRTIQSQQGGTYHRTRDVDSIDKIDLNALYTGKELINIIRARTFPPYKGAYFENNGKRIYMSLHLEYENEGL